MLSIKIVQTVYNNDTHRKLHSNTRGLTKGFCRIWTVVVFICSLGVGLPLVFSCHSNQTGNLHLFTIQTESFLQDYLSKNDTDGNMLKSQLAHVNTSLLPQTYYFGMSGLCTKSNTTGFNCTSSFPVTFDIPKVIFTDVERLANITLPDNFPLDAKESTIDSLSKATVALIITSMIWAFLTTVLVAIAPDMLGIQAILLLILALLVLGSWFIGNTTFFMEWILFDLGGPLSKTNTSNVTPPASLEIGPGFIIFIMYTICLLVLTPMLAFWSIVTAVILIIVTVAAVVFAIEITFVVACLALGVLAGGGAGAAAGSSSGGSSTPTYYPSSPGFNFGN